MSNSSNSSNSSSNSSNSNTNSNSSSYPDWTSLPADLLGTIVQKTLSLADFLHLSLVCRIWFEVAASNSSTRKGGNNRQLPLLLIPTTYNAAVSPTHRRLYNLTTNSIININNLRVPNTIRFCGSSHGWLISLDIPALIISLTNPFSSSDHIISLPPFTGDQLVEVLNDQEYYYKEYYIRKAVLSADPTTNPNGYKVMVIYGKTNRLAFYEAGVSSWTFIQTDRWNFASDVIYRKEQGKFYVIGVGGSVYSYNEASRSLIMEIGEVPRIEWTFCRRYIVESAAGDILQVWRLFGDYDLGADNEHIYDSSNPFIRTAGFRVFKAVVVDPNGLMGWVELRDLEGGALFLGDNHSIWVKASDCPGCRGAIYCTMERWESYGYGSGGIRNPEMGLNMMVYNLEERIISRHYAVASARRGEGYWRTPAIWIVPTLQGRGY